METSSAAVVPVAAGDNEDSLNSTAQLNTEGNFSPDDLDDVANAISITPAVVDNEENDVDEETMSADNDIDLEQGSNAATMNPDSLAASVEVHQSQNPLWTPGVVVDTTSGIQSAPPQSAGSNRITSNVQNESVDDSSRAVNVAQVVAANQSEPHDVAVDENRQVNSEERLSRRK